MPSWTIASIRAWPKAPRDLLVGEHVAQGRDLRGEVGEVLVRVVDDAEPLMQLAQSCPSCCAWCFSIDWPTRWVTESSRSLTARAISACRPASACAIASTRPEASACARSISWRRCSSSSARAAWIVASSGVALARPRHHDGDDEQQQQRRARQSRSATSVRWTGQPPIMNKIWVHAALCSRFARQRERRGNIYG